MSKDLQACKVLLSIHHIHAEGILSGEKELEMRKTAPSCPCTVLMYETKKNGGAGAVVGLFECRAKIKTNAFSKKGATSREGDAYRADVARRACLSEDELYTYANNGSVIGLVVSTPIRFPRPRPLSDFGVKRAPQSWQYLK